MGLMGQGELGKHQELCPEQAIGSYAMADVPMLCATGALHCPTTQHMGPYSAPQGSCVFLFGDAGITQAAQDTDP